MAYNSLNRTIAIAVSAYWMVGCQSVPALETAETATRERPNVLVLMFDDMRFDSFSYRGGPVATPNIDQLAQTSTRFDYAMTTTGLCSPSRAAFFTGRWGHKTGLDDNIELWHSRLQELSPDEGGIIRRAADSGYSVAYIGKWHLGAQGPALRGADYVTSHAATRPRFVEFRTPYDREEDMDRYRRGERDKGGEKAIYYETVDGTYEDTATASKVRDAAAFFDQAADSDSPFFAVVSFNQPHPPYHVPEPYASMYDPATVQLPDNHAAERQNKPLTHDGIYWPWHDTAHMTDLDWRRSRAHYYGAVAMVDRAIGEILQAAEEHGLADDLHVVLIGDQGSMIGEHQLFDKGPYAYDELMRIPLLVKDPDLSPRIINRHVSLIDVPATLSEWMGLTPDGPTDGRSLTPLMRDGDEALSDQDDSALYAYEWYNGAWFGIRAIRTHDFKFVWHPSDARNEFYDLRDDPGELLNQIDNPAYAEARSDLISKLEAELVRIEDPSVERLRFQMGQNDG